MGAVDWHGSGRLASLLHSPRQQRHSHLSFRPCRPCASSPITDLHPAVCDLLQWVRPWPATHQRLPGVPSLCPPVWAMVSAEVVCTTTCTHTAMALNYLTARACNVPSIGWLLPLGGCCLSTCTVCLNHSCSTLAECCRVRPLRSVCCTGEWNRCSFRCGSTTQPPSSPSCSAS